MRHSSLSVTTHDNQAVTRCLSGSLGAETDGRSMLDITRVIRHWLSDEAVITGVLTLHIKHTSASLTIQENADPDVQTDLLDALDGLAPEHAPYRHSSEGPDDMPAHIKSMLTAVNLSIPVVDGHMQLGTWQGIYLIEHRSMPHHRTISLSYLGT